MNGSNPDFFGPLLFLRGAPLFARAQGHEIAAVARRVSQEFVPSGSQVLPAVGDVPMVVFVVRGSLEVQIADTTPHMAPIGESVGLLECLAGQSDAVVAEARSDCMLLKLEFDDLLDLWERHFGLLRAAVEALAERVLSQPDLPHSQARSIPVLEPSPHDLVHNVQVLRECGTFPPGEMEALIELADDVEVVSLAKGETVPLPGGVPPDRFFVARHGSFTVTAVNGDAEIGSTQTVGLLELLAEEPLVRTFVAAADLTALSISRDSILDALDDHFKLSLGVMGRLARHSLGIETVDY